MNHVKIMMLLQFIILTALLSTFVLNLLDKWKIKEWVQIHGNDLFSKLFNCNFCLSFWMNGIFALTMAVIARDPTFLFIPIFATPLTNNLI